MSLFGTGRREGFLAVMLLIALAMVQHAPGVLFGHPRAPLDPTAVAAGRASSIDANAEAATNQTILLPAMRQAGEVIRAGSLPTWNPFARFGEPFTATGAPLLYPPFWPFLLEDGDRFLDLVLLAHAALACTLAYRMLRAMAVSRYSAFLGGGLYGLGWFLTASFDRLPEAAAAAWLPWIVGSCRTLLFARQRTRAAAHLGVALAIPFTTGGTATAVLGVLLALAWSAAGLLAIDREDRRATAGAIALGGLFTALLTAPIWMNAIDLAGAFAPSSAETTQRLQVAGLAATFVPGMFGELGGRAPHALADANPAADALELALYPGALALFVALMGLLRPKRTRLALFWLLVAGGALLIALDGPVGDATQRVLPIVTARPGAVLALFHLATIILVALGLENFFDAPRARRFAVPITSAAVGAVGLVTLVCALFVPGILGRVVALATGPVDASELRETVDHAGRALLAPAIATILVALAFAVWRRLGILRFKTVLATVALGELCALALLHVPRADRVIDASAAAVLPSDAGRVVRVGEPDLPPGGWIAGGDGLRVVDTDGDRILERTARYLELVEPGFVRTQQRARVGPIDRPSRLDDPLLAIADVGATVSSRMPPVNTFVPLLSAPAAETVARTVAYVAPVAPPRARVAFRAEAAPDPVSATRALQSRVLAGADGVVLEDASPEFVCARPATPPAVEVLEDRPDRLRIRVDVGDGRGYLVVPDALAPGWTARIDGQPTRILPADVAFRAVAVREGAHEVVFEYRARGVTLGLAVAAGGAALALALIVLARRR